MEVGRQRNAAKEDQVVDTVEHVERRSVMDRRITKEHDRQSGVAEAKHDPFAVVIDQLAHPGRRHRD